MTPDQVLSITLREWSETFMKRSFRDFRRFMEQNDLSHSQVGALMHLHHCGSCAISEIGDHMGITLPAASQMIERLVQQGWLERSEDQQDRRYKIVCLTPRGQELVESGIAVRLQWLEELTASLAPAEQRAIAAALKLLTETARNLDIEDPHHPNCERK